MLDCFAEYAIYIYNWNISIKIFVRTIQIFCRLSTSPSVQIIYKYSRTKIPSGRLWGDNLISKHFSTSYVRVSGCGGDLRRWWTVFLFQAICEAFLVLIIAPFPISVSSGYFIRICTSNKFIRSTQVDPVRASKSLTDSFFILDICHPCSVER